MWYWRFLTEQCSLIGLKKTMLYIKESQNLLIINNKNVNLIFKFWEAWKVDITIKICDAGYHWANWNEQSLNILKVGLHAKMRMIMTCIWWDCKEVIYYELLQKNQVINSWKVDITIKMCNASDLWVNWNGKLLKICQELVSFIRENLKEKFFVFTF